MEGPETAAAWETALQRDGRIEVGFRRAKTMALGIVAVLFVLGALLVTVSADSTGDRVTGTFGAVFFGAVAVVLLRRATTGGTAAVVTAEGVGAPGYRWTVPWDRAYGAFVFRQRGTAIVCLAVEPAYMETYLASASRAMRVLVNGNRRLLGIDAMSLPTPLKIDEDAFAAWLSTRCRARPPEQVEE